MGQTARTGMVVRDGSAGTRVGAGGVDDEATFAGAVGDRHAERVEQREVFVGGTTARGEVVADDQCVRTGEEAHRLQLAEHVLTSTGEAEPRAREHEPEQRDGLQALRAARSCGARRAACRSGAGS